MKYTNIFIFALFLSSCGGNEASQNAVNPSDSTNASMGAENSSVPTDLSSEIKGLLGTFVGDLPCDDCESIKIAVSLNGNQSAITKQKKMGAPNNNGIVGEMKGKWTTSDDQSEVVVTGENGTIQRYRIVDTNTLLPLDGAGKPAACNKDCTLTKATLPNQN